jgi:hypothetical protein
MFGGGAAYSTLISWGKRNTPPDDWTNQDGELIPGRFMYDFPHWQSVVGIRPARQAAMNIPDFAPWPNASPGRVYSGHGMDHDLSTPNYDGLINNPVFMQVLMGRTCATDPPPPQRFCNSFYLATSYAAEFIGSPSRSSSAPNFIREDADPTPDGSRDESTLDTLYLALGGTVPTPAPVMTYYHGFQTPQMVFSGFPLWYFQRQQIIVLADFVMQQIFNIPRDNSAPRGLTVPTRLRTARAIAPKPPPILSTRTASIPLHR